MIDVKNILLMTQLNTNNQSGGKAKWVFIIIFLIVIIQMGRSFDDKTEKQTIESAIASGELDTTGIGSYADNYSEWTYPESVDRMTNEKKHYAELISSNKVDFKFPYNGGSTFIITLMRNNGKNDVLLTVDKGQFIHRFSSSNEITVKFDDGKPIKFPFVMPTDGSSDNIFIENSDKFISKLKKSKQLLIGAEFYQEGTQYIEFYTSGLEWNY